MPDWGGEYFAINPRGHVQVTPQGRGGPAIDVRELIAQIRRRGVAAPMLLRFDDILRSRVGTLREAFDQAREEFGYGAPYLGVYPVKVNQDHWVVEALLEGEHEAGLGLEVGSKPELMAAITLQASQDSLLVCNGYKDVEYIEMALLGSRLGIDVVLVVDTEAELDIILDAAERLRIRPHIGLRIKLTFRSTGRWRDSVGDRSKFGLTSRQVVAAVERLRERGYLDCLELLHFHIGSQIAHIRSIKQAMHEATHVLVGLHRLGVHIRWFDAGGGLGVDYDGSKSATDSSKNYSLQEYANDIVWHLADACEKHGIDQPVIVTESGRAVAAHHALLVAEVLGWSHRGSGQVLIDVGEEEHFLVREMAEVCEEVGDRDPVEHYHDALETREQAMVLFNSGQMELTDRARVEEFFWCACRSIQRQAGTLEWMPEDLVELERDLADTLFLNASIFQSVPDAWAVQQLFPILPLQRLDEEPTRRAILADLTCDSDGKITQFVGPEGTKETLEVHSLVPDEPYYLGFFLVGAYQEILGDLHNLFGDTNVVHVALDAADRPRLVHVQRGDRVKEVLAYVQYFEKDLLRSLRDHVEGALEEGRMSYEESALLWSRYEAGLHGYTYLNRSVREAQLPAEETMHEDQERMPS